MKASTTVSSSALSRRSAQGPRFGTAAGARAATIATPSAASSFSSVAQATHTTGASAPGPAIGGISGTPGSPLADTAPQSASPMDTSGAPPASSTAPAALGLGPSPASAAIFASSGCSWKHVRLSCPRVLQWAQAPARSVSVGRQGFFGSLRGPAEGIRLTPVLPLPLDAASMSIALGPPPRPPPPPPVLPAPKAVTGVMDPTPIFSSER